jgi:hypothetical protein
MGAAPAPDRSLSEVQRKDALALFDTGWGAKAVATRFGAPGRAIRGRTIDGESAEVRL